LVAPAAAQTPYRVKDINEGLQPGPASDPRNLTECGGVLFFTARDGATGEELWKSDGMPGPGTALVKDIVPGPGSSSPSQLTNVGGTLFFTVAGRSQLWKSDGTAAGTVLVKQLFNI
jgi:ELWxxDGT repeat protein